MNTNARLKSKAMPHPQKVMSVVKSPRLEPCRTKRIGFGSENPGRLKGALRDRDTVAQRPRRL
jgi:hypothetical protein